jgi:hypothetical protein
MTSSMPGQPANDFSARWHGWLTSIGPAPSPLSIRYDSRRFALRFYLDRHIGITTLAFGATGF